MSRLMLIALGSFLLCCAAISTVCAHEHKPPHQGTLIELGEEFAHLEVVVNAATGKVTVYLLDGEAEKSVRIKDATLQLQFNKINGKDSTIKLELKASEDVLTGEKVGDSSEFSVQSDALKNVKDFEAVLAVLTTKGTKFENVKISFPKGNDKN